MRCDRLVNALVGRACDRIIAVSGDLNRNTSDLWEQSGPSAAHTDPHARGEAVQVHAVLQGVREFVVPVSAHAHPFGHKALPLRDLPAEVHAAEPPAAAHPNAHGRQAVQVSPPWLHQGLQPAVQPAEPLALPSDRQALQVQLLLQVLQRRAQPPRAHTQAQGVQAPQDPHLPVLR
ncbi:hypothetical protein QAD02_022197 [Eretmocerus hayati]|uniref:Uncharacterized protein n=1 Tax=Eretmocerus hayati TaxID=131215 RepID=A0ACC2PTE9_9HYME|nr:hypothetical protein QAD02_022197 [Eretmocerus hayati]